MAHLELNVIVHHAEEGGYWAEVPAIPGCATEGDTFDELCANLDDAVEACLSLDLGDFMPCRSKPQRKTAMCKPSASSKGLCRLLEPQGSPTSALCE